MQREAVPPPRTGGAAGNHYTEKPPQAGQGLLQNALLQHQGEPHETLPRRAESASGKHHDSGGEAPPGEAIGGGSRGDSGRASAEASSIQWRMSAALFAWI